MMNHLSLGLGLAAGLFFATPALAEIGDKMLELDIELVHPDTDSFDAFKGRAILVEFFAHW